MSAFLLSPLVRKLALAALAIGLAIGAFKYWEHMVAENAALEIRAKSFEVRVAQLEQQRFEDQQRMLELGETVMAAETDRDAAIIQLNTYRQRLTNAALKKPQLIGRKATKATNDGRLELCRISGGCQGD